MKKIILLSALFFYCLQPSNAQPGELDPSFGNNGVVTADLGVNYNYPFSAKKVLLQSDGSMYLILNLGGVTVINKRHQNGSTDSSYGQNGFSTVGKIYPNDAVLQPDGKIVVAGKSDGNMAIVRYNIDGGLDHTFGVNGKQIINPTLTYGTAEAHSVAIQIDGKIVVVGSFRPLGYFYDQYFAIIARCNTDGSPDSNFLGNGEFRPIEQREGCTCDNTSLSSVALQHDGKIVAVIGYDSFVIERYNPDGSVDSTFNGNGSQTNAFSSSANLIAIQKDDKIVIGDGNFSLARYNTDGSLDNSFSGDGKQTTTFGKSSSLALQNDGKIVVAGYMGDYPNYDIALARYNTDGTLDDSFSGDGKLTTDFNGGTDIANSVALQSDGKVVVAGSSFVRYNSVGNLESTFNEDGKLTSSGHQGVTVYKTATINGGKIIVVGTTWNGSTYDGLLVKYNINGSLDSTFSEDGIKVVNLQFNSITFQDDEKMVLVTPTNIARLNADGSIDSTFSQDGIQSVDFPIASAASQSDGKIVAVGKGDTIDYYGNHYSTFAVVRYNTDGTLDKSFSDDGEQAIALYDKNYEELVSSYASLVAIQGDGKIVVAGAKKFFSQEGTTAVVVRYNTNGSPENIFTDNLGFDYPTSMAVGSNGNIVLAGIADDHGDKEVALVSIDSTDYPYLRIHPSFLPFTPYSVAVQSNGKIIMAGRVIARFNADGSLDGTFSSDGIQTPEGGVNAIAISNNKLYVIGSGQYPGTLGVIARYLLDGNSQTPPKISLATPAHDTTLTTYGYAKITLNAVALDADGTISKVDFYSNNTLLHTESVAPYGYIWHNVTAGNYTITAKATDNDGNVTTSDAVHISVVPDKAPTVNITSPANGASYRAYSSITLSADANDVDGTIKKVDFFNGSTLIFTEYVAPFKRGGYRLPLGNYFITAKATDNNGRATTSQPVAISVVSNLAPGVTITSPANRTTYVSPATIILSADASDVDGTIKKVDFYNTSTLLFTENDAPYFRSWPDVPEGDYSITAIVTDNEGKITTSAPVTISVIAASKSLVKEDRLNSSKEPLSLNVNPNPVANILNISVHGLQTNHSSTISVLSVSGAVIKTIQPGALNKNVQLDVSSLSGGVYFIKVINGDTVLYKQFVKL